LGQDMRAYKSVCTCQKNSRFGHGSAMSKVVSV
jgi:hypothetical protein